MNNCNLKVIVFNSQKASQVKFACGQRRSVGNWRRKERFLSWPQKTLCKHKLFIKSTQVGEVLGA